MTRPLLSASAVASLLLGACSSSEAPQVVASLAVSPATLDIPMGSVQQLHVTARDASSRSINNPQLTYSSSNTAIATVSTTGLVSGKASGFDTITVVSGAVSTTATIAVVTHPGGSTAGAPAVGSRPFGIAVSRNGLVYVTRGDVPYLQLTQLSDTSFHDSLKVGAEPTDVAFASTGATAYVTNQSSGNVGIVDVQNKQEVDSVDVSTFGNPFRVRVGSDDQHIYVSTSAGYVLEIATATKGITQKWLLTPDAVNGLAFRPDGTILYATSTDGTLYEITISTGGIRWAAPGGTLQEITVSRDALELWIANEAGPMLVLNAATGAPIDSITGASGVFGMSLSSDGTQVYAAVPGSGQVLIIDRASRSVVGPLSVGGAPRRIAFNRLGTEALVANESGYISVVK